MNKGIERGYLKDEGSESQLQLRKDEKKPPFALSAILSALRLVGVFSYN